VEKCWKSLAVLDLARLDRYPRRCDCRLIIRRKKMKGLKSTIVLAAVIAAVAVSACRREEHHGSMKLGADVPKAVEVAR
jgi:hypothetical protein